MGKNSKAQQAEMKRQYQEARRREELERQKRQNRMIWQIAIGVVAAVLMITAIALAISFGQKNKNNESTNNNANAVAMDTLDFSAVTLEQCTNTEDVTNYVRMNISYTDKNGVLQTGDVIVRLYAEVAPKTVANFQSLVKEDFYDGLTFHRVSKGFMIQGGDPEGDGSGSSTAIKGEMTNNGFTNNLSHIRGVLSMARRGDSYDSGSCQFFIMHEDNTGLDGEYASFGYVVYGMDTVDAITEIDLTYAASSIDANPTKPVNPVTINYMTFVTVSK